MIDTVDERLRGLIIKHSVVSIACRDIKDDTDLINDLGFDSVQIMRFLAEIENEFGIEIEDEYLSLEILGKFKSLKEAIETRISPEKSCI